MADDETERPSLEVPQLFGRRRKAARRPAQPPAAPAPEPVVEPAIEAAPEPVVEADAEPVVEPAAETRVFEDSGLDITTPLPSVDEAPAEADDAAPSAPRRTLRLRRGSRAAGSTQVLDPEVDDADIDDVDDRDDDEVPVERQPRRPLPLPSGPVAAALTGVVVGLSLVGLTWLGFRGCEAVRGSSSCGTGPGMAALLLILVLAVVIGGLLLSRFGVPDPGATSFLGTGLTGVVCLLFLVEHLDAWPMVFVIPAIAALTFLASWWVTTRYVEVE